MQLVAYAASSSRAMPTNDALRLRVLAKERGTTVRGAVHRLLEEYAGSTSQPPPPQPDLVAIHVVYNGARINARFDTNSEGVEILDGALAGKVFKSPSGAAIAIVRQYNPRVHPNRNGWSFFTVTSTGELLQSIRRGRWAHQRESVPPEDLWRDRFSW
jgi:hypothetical protein